jgi:ferredoxin
VYAPATFGQDDSTISIVIDPDGDSADDIRLAVESCPTQAIAFIEDGTGASGPG